MFLFLQTLAPPAKGTDVTIYFVYILALAIVGLWLVLKYMHKNEREDYLSSIAKLENQLKSNEEKYSSQLRTSEEKYQNLHNTFMNDKDEQIRELKEAKVTYQELQRGLKMK